MNKICPGKAMPIEQKDYSKFEEKTYWECLGNHHSYTGVKRIRMKCELCGRKVMSSLYNNEDGDLFHVLPPHKIKEWWKAKNRV